MSFTCKRSVSFSTRRRCASSSRTSRFRCRDSRYSFDTDYQKSVVSGSEIPPSVVQTGWLWEVSSKTTKQKLDHLQLQPKKSLGQNFVIDESILERISAATGIDEGEPVIEFGPGTGNLTRHLLARKAHVTAIEKDDVLHQKLRQEFQEESLTVIHADIMTVNIQSVISDILQKYPEKSRIKIISNLPYNITTECLKLYLPLGNVISNLLFMVQDEVAQRLCSETAGRSDYRAMTVYAHHFSTPRYLFKIDKEAYYPQPLVDGALVDFELKCPEARQHHANESRFISFVNQSFASKRKKLINSLRPTYEPDEIRSVLERLDLSENLRGQEMTYDQFVSVFGGLEELRSSSLVR